MGNDTNIFVFKCSCGESSLWSILLSIAPIIVAVIAIVVPAIIAHKQNRIALYEKRFECYQQLESLKAFFVYIQKITNFEESDEVTNPTWSCQQSYFNAHSLLEDKDYQRQRLDAVHQVTYMRFCIEMDRKLLLSLKLLVAKKKEIVHIYALQKALTAFVESLFKASARAGNSKVTNTPGKNMETADFEEMVNLKNQFIAAFESISCLETRLENLLKMKR